jgi:two-component system sensor histidine kinase QseC
MMMAHRWRQWLRPTLVGRLMLAQVVLLSLLWSLFVVFAMIDGADNAGTFNQLAVYDAVLSVAEDLTGAPELQRHSLVAIERAVRADFEAGLIPELAPHLQVWQGSRLLYRTPGPLPVIHGNGREGAETIYVQGERWHMRTHLSARSDTRVEMLAPSETWYFFLTLNSRGYYLLPLMISMPFLLAPAWLSIRLALRPWSRMAQEVATRGPRDLRPLVFKPPHRELAAMADNINALLLRVSESARRERNFIADAAHELRTPLAAMRVNVEALQARTREPRQLELLGSILNSGDRAARLVHQLLVLMHSETAPSGPQQLVVLDVLLQERLAVLSSLGTGSGVEVELQAQHDVHVFGQRDYLISLIDNLVENAIKYSPPLGIVAVALATEGDSVVLSVSDQGPGIAPALRQRVFDRFFRAPQQTQGGSGLGLSIARAAAQHHGGAILLSDAPEGGLLVRVQLPVTQHSAPVS